MKILSLDQSTNKTGYAIFQDTKLIKYELIDLSTLSADVTERINQLKKEIYKIIIDNDIDVVGYEDTQIQYVFNPKTKSQTVRNVDTFKKLTKNLGVMEDLCFEKEICFHTVINTEWKSFNKVKGRKREEQKANAILKVKELFYIDVDSDIADAILLGNYIVRKVLKIKE